jgi:hypothetical protein
MANAPDSAAKVISFNLTTSDGQTIGFEMQVDLARKFIATLERRIQEAEVRH